MPLKSDGSNLSGGQRQKLELARALIRRMPMGMQTTVAEGATDFSQSQRQLLALARALAPRPAILFLDETTAHLDLRRNHRLQQVLVSLSITHIVNTQHPDTVRYADRVVVLSRGAIAAEEPRCKPETALQTDLGPFL